MAYGLNDNIQMKKVGRFIVNTDKILGKGSFATTCQAWSNSQPKVYYACKVTAKKDIESDKENIDYLISRVKEEVKSWKELSHPNVVRFFECQESKNNLYFFLELCQQGTMQSYIDSHRFEKNESEILQFSQELIRAGYYLFERGIIHRDIKPDNILLRQNHVKLSDFGLARIIDPDQCKTNTYTMTFVGTPVYMAPEVLQSLKYAIKCDVWSIGVTIYELVTGELPFKVSKMDQSPILIAQKIKTEKCPFNQPLFEKNIELRKMVEAMLKLDPDKRMSIEEAFKISEQFKY